MFLEHCYGACLPTQKASFRNSTIGIGVKSDWHFRARNGSVLVLLLYWLRYTH